MGNERLDILAANELGRALFSELYAGPARPVNNARFVFLDRRAEAFYADWERAARATASPSCARPRAATRTTATSQTSSASSQPKARRSAPAGRRTTSAFTTTAVKHFHHPVVGELSLSFNRLDLAADHGLTIFTYAAEPGSRSEEALRLLGSWAATVDATDRSPQAS